MNVHFIAIGGAAMHNLALSLHNKGYNVTGSDDEIFDPSKSRLQAKGLLPETFGCPKTSTMVSFMCWQVSVEKPVSFVEIKLANIIPMAIASP